MKYAIVLLGPIQMVTLGRCQIYFRIKYNRSKVISTFVIQLYGRMFHRLKFREIVAAQIYIALQDTPQRQQECIEL